MRKLRILLTRIKAVDRYNKAKFLKVTMTKFLGNMYCTRNRLA